MLVSRKVVLLLLWAHRLFEVCDHPLTFGMKIKVITVWTFLNPLNHLLQLPVGSGTHVVMAEDDIANVARPLNYVGDRFAHFISQWMFSHEFSLVLGSSTKNK